MPGKKQTIGKKHPLEQTLDEMKKKYLFQWDLL